jgi:hypothetical protein
MHSTKKETNAQVNRVMPVIMTMMRYIMNGLMPIYWWVMSPTPISVNKPSIIIRYINYIGLA